MLLPRFPLDDRDIVEIGKGLADCSYLQAVLQHAAGPDGNPQSFQGSHDGLDDMRRRLKHVWPHVVQEVVEGIFAAEAVHTQRHVLNHSAGRLSVDQVPARPHKQQVNIGAILKEHSLIMSVGGIFVRVL